MILMKTITIEIFNNIYFLNCVHIDTAYTRRQDLITDKILHWEIYIFFTFNNYKETASN